MLRSMYSGVSGMKMFQTKLDVIGNNISNVNTVGYKKSRTVFQDILSQNLSGATAPVDGFRGGVNPMQVGLGVSMASIDVMHTPGSPMTTGLASDLLIEGDGFFLVIPQGGNPNEPLYTRAGNFTLDAERQLANPQGDLVVTEVSVGQLDPVSNQFTTTDTQLLPLKIPEGIISYGIQQDGQIFGVTEDGHLAGIVYNDDTEEFIIVTSDTEDLPPTSSLVLGFVSNESGLRKVGGSLYEMTANANPGGNHDISTVGDSGRTTQIIAGQLEMSNVDLTEEFTEMIVAQRGFQANSRIITTSDEILQEVVNLKR